MTRAWRQPTLFPLPLARNIVLIKTTDIDITTSEGGRILMERMRAVPLNKSILLDFHLHHKKEDPYTDDQLEWRRLAALLNSRVRGQRFDFFGDGIIPQMFRKSIRDRSWIPKGLDLKVNTK